MAGGRQVRTPVRELPRRGALDGAYGESNLCLPGFNRTLEPSQLRLRERPAGIEPAPSAWKAVVLPLNTTDAWSRMRESNSPLSRTKARWSQTIRRKPRQGLEPCDPAYQGGVLLLRARREPSVLSVDTTRLLGRGWNQTSATRLRWRLRAEADAGTRTQNLSRTRGVRRQLRHIRKYPRQESNLHFAAG